MAISRRLRFLPCLLVFAVVSFGDADLRAHSCIANGPACEATWKFDAVFVGHIDEILPTDETSQTGVSYPWRVRVRVYEGFRGAVPGDVVDVFTSHYGGGGGYEFQVGQIYLIYASRHPTTRRLSASVCSRTSLLSRATADLSYLRSLPPENTGLGTIQGSATRQTPDGDPVPLVGGRVTIRGAGADRHRSYSATTDAGGRFAVRAPTGKYLVSLDVPGELHAGGVLETELIDARGCAATMFFARANGRINGRVLDAHGMPVPFLPVDVVDAAAVNGQNIFPLSTTLTDEAGVFEVARLQPSSYKLGVHLRRSERAEWTLWFPGIVSGDRSAISIGFGERVGMADVVLPDDTVPVLIEGSVADADGRPLTGEYVYLFRGDNMLAMPFWTDGDGRFRLSLIEGRPYRLSIEGRVGSEFRIMKGTEFTARKGLPPFNMRFDR